MTLKKPDAVIEFVVHLFLKYVWKLSKTSTVHGNQGNIEHLCRYISSMVRGPVECTNYSDKLLNIK